MYHKVIISISLLLTLLLSACSSEPKKRYFPPQVSLQQLQRLENGQWQTQIRIQSFSTGSVIYQNLSVKIQFQDLEWVTLSAPEPIQIGPSNAEIISVYLTVPANIQSVLSDRLNKSQSIRYVLNGQLESVEPKQIYTLDYQGRMNPAPGLNGVFR
jgi:hypothetical protein